MATSRYSAVVDAILTALRADSTLSSIPAQIVDGPMLTQEYGTTVIYIGWEGDPENDSAGTISQNYHDMGPSATRDETISIFCVVQVFRGDDDMSTARSDAGTALGAIESVLRTTPALGLANVLRCEMSDSAVRQVRSDLGIAVEHAFTITVTSLI